MSRRNCPASSSAIGALPVTGVADLTRENVVRFDQLLKESESEKVLMHCASGNRVGAMMALRARWLEGSTAVMRWPSAGPRA